MLLYIHIPFCDSKCFYCAFNSYTNLSHLKKEYIKSLTMQLKYELSKIKLKKLKSIFIGGGTPSSIEAHEYKIIFNILNRYIDKNCEITIEANPNSAKKQWLKEIRLFGVNRISFGVQSFNDEKLRFLGRNHNKQQAIDAINYAYEIGFKDINCDIIYDTKLDTKKLITYDLNIIKNLPINHISAYSLIIENNTKFEDQHHLRIENIPLAKYIFNTLKNFGFNQYEVSAFSKDKSSQSIHNKGYWQKNDYIGVGSGAVGYIKDTRYYSISNIENYIKTPCNYENKEYLTQDDIKLETIFLGLRCCIGIKLEIFNQKELSNIAILEKEKKITIKDKRVFNNNYLLSDEITLFIQG